MISRISKHSKYPHFKVGWRSIIGVTSKDQKRVHMVHGNVKSPIHPMIFPIEKSSMGFSMATLGASPASISASTAAAWPCWMAAISAVSWLRFRLFSAAPRKIKWRSTCFGDGGCETQGLHTGVRLLWLPWAIGATFDGNFWRFPWRIARKNPYVSPNMGASPLAICMGKKTDNPRRGKMR